MIESVVIRCIKQLNPTLKHIVGGQNGYNPNQIFVIVEEVDSFLVGTATRTLTSRTGKWLQQQTKQYVVRVGVQGTVSPELSDKAELLQLYLDTPMIRQNFQDEGYTLKVGRQILPLDMKLDSHQYKRYSIQLDLTTSISLEVEQTPIEGVGIKGDFVMEKDKSLVYEYEDSINKNDG